MPAKIVVGSGAHLHGRDVHWFEWLIVGFIFACLFVGMAAQSGGLADPAEDDEALEDEARDNE